MVLFIREKDEDKVIYESVLNEDQLDRIYDVIKNMILIWPILIHQTL